MTAVSVRSFRLGAQCLGVLAQAALALQAGHPHGDHLVDGDVPDSRREDGALERNACHSGAGGFGDWLCLVVVLVLAVGRLVLVAVPRVVEVAVSVPR
jgi:hypothetical protein